MSQNTEKHTPLLQVIDLHTSFKTRQLTVSPIHWKRARALVS